MTRRVFDLLASAAGILLVIILIVAGALLMWGYSFANSQVHNQLAQQQIFFPPKSQMTSEMTPYIGQWAGQQVLTGAQAEGYADHYIAVHLSEMPYGGVYSKISAAAQKDPNNAQLKQLQATSFMGTTLRGLLLQAYAFGTLATIALWAGIAAFIGAFLLLLLVLFGFWHARRTPPEKEFLAPKAAANR